MNEARTSEVIIIAAQRAFAVGYLRGVVANRREGPVCADDNREAEAQFKEWWNRAAGFEEVK